MINKTLIKLFFIVLMSFVLTHCGGKKEDEQAGELKTYTVKKKTMTKVLYFSGAIKPLKTSSVISPIDGTIEDKYFSYGNRIKRGQKLFTLLSDKLQTDFADAISGYLKADSDYKTKVRKYKASEELWHLKFIAYDDFEQASNDKKDSFIALMQAEYKIIKISKQLGIYEELLKIKKITPDIIKQLLLTSKNYIRIHAPKAGVALMPSGDSSNGGGSKPIAEGSQIKVGQVLVGIGDLKGFKIDVQVNEININQIKVGQQADVTGPAFSNINLKGHVSQVDAQAQTQSGGLPQFPVTIDVPSVSAQDKQTIHVGMTAKVAIKIQKPGVITVPLKAVTEKGGASVVTVKDKKGKTREVTVIPGITMIDSVVIKSGLNVGDVIVYHN